MFAVYLRTYVKLLPEQPNLHKTLERRILQLKKTMKTDKKRTHDDISISVDGNSDQLPER